MSKEALFSLFLILILGEAAQAFTPPVIPAVRVDAAPLIDGDLSDECWQNSPDADDFYFIAKGTEAEEPTCAWIRYDDRFIYVAFHCKDSYSDQIKTQVRKRGGNLNIDDHVFIGIGGYEEDGRTAWFGVTAAGVQADQIPWIDASKIEWRGDWDASARRVGDGYVVEMAIPVSLLQYKPGKTDMRLWFQRGYPRLDTWWSAPDVGPTKDWDRRFVWQGVILPRPSPRPRMMAYSLVGTGEGNAVQRTGLDVRYPLTPSLTGLFTLNPYFDDVEQGVVSADFTYTERQLSDSRPFFQEGGSFFHLNNIFYTRRIANIDAGVKVYGKMGTYNLAFMNAQDFGDEDHTVFQIGRQWVDRGELWLCAVNSNTPSVNNLATMISTNRVLYNRNDVKIRWSGHYVNADNASGPGHGGNLSTTIESWGPPRTLQWSAGYRFVDEDHDPYLGYVPEKGLKRWDMSMSFGDQPAAGKISSWSTSLYAGTTNHLDGSLFYNSLSLGADCSWRNGTGVGAWMSRTHRPPYRDSRANLWYWWGGRDLYRNGYADVTFGRMAGGGYFSCYLNQGWLIRDRLTLFLGYHNSRIKAPSPEAYSASQLIGTLAYDFDDERTLAGRLVSNKGKSNAYLAYRQRVRKGLDAYCILGDPNAETTRSSLTLKLVRML